MEKTRQLLVLVPALTLLLTGALLFAHVLAPPATPQPKEFTGSLFVSDAGQSHGGFEYTASWDAVLRVTGTSGMLNLSLNLGLGDALTQHIFNVTDFQTDPSTNQMTFSIDGHQVVMPKISVDKIWNETFNGYNVASWGGYAPSEELIGTINPNIFPGLAEFWYVELRLM